jgi:two-component system LytT family response regulator
VLDQMREPRWLQRVVVEDNQRGRPIAVDRILWLQADRNYVRVHARDGGGRLRATLSDLAERLDPDRFARVSRSAVINIDAVREIQAWFRGDRLFVMEDGSEIRGSRVFLGENPVLAELIGRHR